MAIAFSTLPGNQARPEAPRIQDDFLSRYSGDLLVSTQIGELIDELGTQRTGTKLFFVDDGGTSKLVDLRNPGSPQIAVSFEPATDDRPYPLVIINSNGQQSEAKAELVAYIKEAHRDAKILYLDTPYEIRNDFGPSRPSKYKLNPEFLADDLRARLNRNLEESSPTTYSVSTIEKHPLVTIAVELTQVGASTATEVASVTLQQKGFWRWKRWEVVSTNVNSANEEEQGIISQWLRKHSDIYRGQIQTAVNLFKSPEDKDRLRGCKILGLIDDPRAGNLLLRRLNDDQSLPVKEAAANALKVHTDPKTIEDLVDIIHYGPKPQIGSAFEGKQHADHIKELALGALKGRNDQTTVRLVQELAYSGRPHDQNAAAILQTLGHPGALLALLDIDERTYFRGSEEWLRAFNDRVDLTHHAVTVFSVDRLPDELKLAVFEKHGSPTDPRTVEAAVVGVTEADKPETAGALAAFLWRSLTETERLGLKERLRTMSATPEACGVRTSRDEAKGREIAVHLALFASEDDRPRSTKVVSTAVNREMHKSYGATRKFEQEEQMCDASADHQAMTAFFSRVPAMADLPIAIRCEIMTGDWNSPEYRELKREAIKGNASDWTPNEAKIILDRLWYYNGSPESEDALNLLRSCPPDIFLGEVSRLWTDAQSRLGSEDFTPHYSLFSAIPILLDHRENELARGILQTMVLQFRNEPAAEAFGENATPAEVQTFREGAASNNAAAVRALAGNKSREATACLIESIKGPHEKTALAAVEVASALPGEAGSSILSVGTQTGALPAVAKRATELLRGRRDECARITIAQIVLESSGQSN